MPKLIRAAAVSLAALPLLAAPPAPAQDVVRLGNLKFAHYGAVWYMKEIAPKYGLRIDEKIFAKGLDIVPGNLELMEFEHDTPAPWPHGAVTFSSPGLPMP